jgi:RNA polymerase sigma-70 factor (sigma-E family)
MDPTVSCQAAGISVTAGPGGTGAAGASGPADAATVVTALYAKHALGLTRLALIMVGDRQTAEDIVQDAFCGLHRGWHRLRDPDKALPYVRSAVLNGCRSEFRRSKRAAQASGDGFDAYFPPTRSAESAALAVEQRRDVLVALLALPARQREALLLRFYLDLSEADTASAMHISRGTAKSTVARGLAALRNILGEQS